MVMEARTLTILMGVQGPIPSLGSLAKFCD